MWPLQARGENTGKAFKAFTVVFVLDHVKALQISSLKYPTI